MDLDELADLTKESCENGDSEVPLPTKMSDTTRPSRASLRKAGPVKCGKFYGACIICGLIKQDMPPNSLYCWDHKRSVDAFTAQCKAQDRKNKNNECIEALNNLRDGGKEGPPSEFSSTIMDFEKSSPAQGRGVKRKTVDSMVIMQKYITRTTVRNEAKLVRMHEEQWMNHAKTVMLLSHQDAESRWKKAKETTPKELTDEEGPGGTLRLPMHVEDAIYMGSGVDFEKSAEGSGKRKKMNSDEDLLQEALKMQTDHVGFKDEMFSKVGGGAALQIACNSSGVVSSSCLGVFGQEGAPDQGKGSGRHGMSSSPAGSSDASASPQTLLGIQMSPAASVDSNNSGKKGKAKPTKAWDVATQRLKLQSEMATKMEVLSLKVSKLLEACCSSSDKTLPRCFGQNMVRNQMNYLVIMQSKVDIFLAFGQVRNTEFLRQVMAHTMSSEFETNISVLKECTDIIENLKDSENASWLDPNSFLCQCVVKVLQCFNKYRDRDHHENNLINVFGWDTQAKRFKFSIPEDGKKMLLEELNSMSSSWSSVRDALKSNEATPLSACVGACNAVLKVPAGTEDRKVAMANLNSLLGDCLAKDSTADLYKDQLKGTLSKHGWVSGMQGLPESSTNASITEIRSKFMDLWGASTRRLVATTLAQHKGALGKALPFSDAGEVPVIWELQTLQDRAMTIASEDEDKVVRHLFKNFHDSVDKVIRSIGMSYTEALNNVANHDRRVAAEAARIKKQQEAEASKQQKKAQAEAKKKAAKPDAVAAESALAASQSHPLMDMTHECILTWPKFANPDALAKASSEQLKPGVPFVVTDHPCLRGLCEERATKALVGIFRIQFPLSEQAKKDGRGQIPFSGQPAPKLREAMLAAAAPQKDIIQVKPKDKQKENVVQKAIDALSLAACAPGSCYQGLEKQSFATVRHSISGRREILVLNYKDLCKFAAHTKLEEHLAKSQSHEMYVKQVVDALASPEALQTFKDLGGAMYRVVINPGETFFVPMCSWLLERTVGEDYVVGFRTACLMSTQGPCDSLKGFMSNHQKVHGDDNVHQFWTKVLALLASSPTQ